MIDGGASAGQTSSARRVVVLASGSGSNFQALADAGREGTLGGAVVAVVCDQPDAFVIQRGATCGVATDVVPRDPDETRHDYDARLADIVAAHRPDLIVLAGWMRLLSMEFLGRFPGQVINLHPALPGEFPGTHAIERAFRASREGTTTRTGVMVHYVPDEGIDDGPVLATAEVPILANDTIDSLGERIHDTEHHLLVRAVRHALTGRCKPD
ncbi:MAG TPA: phosphoribosylglycinamide formyltransferase [Ilumatobacteraceae bacterium]|nr:phosphoribosylglycinamide formyltransferase [Ilumatobacteraceae bacterium]